MVATVLGAAAVLVLYVEITSTFESRLWKTPATIYSAPLTLVAGSEAGPGAIAARLDRCGYARTTSGPIRPGQYRRRGATVEIYLRPFGGPAGEATARRIEVRFSGERVAAVRDAAGTATGPVRLEPEVLGILYGSVHEDRRVLSLDEVPKRFVDCVLAAEDARFYHHGGVDPRAVLRAMIANLREGRIVQGGSTIPQQTVKNLYLGHARTWWRKLREIPMAVILDLRYSKDRILEVYLNEVYLGQRGSVAICGAEAAARFYYGRGLADLSLAECAQLAGMIRSPGAYNPFEHPERALARRDQVLDALARLGWAEPQAIERAKAEPLQLGSGSAGFSRARYFVDYVRGDLDRYYSARSLEEEGLRVFTTVNTEFQEAAEEALRAGLDRLERDVPAVRRQIGKRALQGSVVVTDPRTGSVLALVGGRDYASTQFNRAVQAHRQPGSCFKPFVYLAGVEASYERSDHGLTPATMLDDSPLSISSGGKTWEPRDYDGEFRGPVTALEALRQSLNVPTVRAAQHVGIERIIDVARACGFESSFDPYPSLALGAQEVTPLELAAAYGTLANGGLAARPRIIQEVRDASGRRVERRDVDLSRAVRPQSAFVVDTMLQGVLDEGTAASARALGYAGRAAGKTGTTDDTRDAWFVGFTPRRLALVWVGYDDNARTGLTGASGALPIWVDLLRRIGDGDADFEPPDGVVRSEIDPETGELAVAGCPQRVEAWFVRGTEPTASCSLHGGGVREFFRRLFGRRPGRSDPI